MINILLSVLFSIFSLQIFTINYKISAFSKTLFNIPISLFEASVPLKDYKEGDKLFFNKSLLEVNINEYFSKSINGLCGEYIIRFVYFSTDDNLFCKTSKCDGVNITLIADILLGIKYKDTMSYHIKENKQ